ncbi:DUF7386 family protein [Halorubrum ezzemoulense]|uniref:DUF7386 family protein n=1 Tax=Halorubrum ezzemoulense TaxID=337243 RepID=UPI003F6DED98
MSRRTSLKITDNCERQLERASEIVASDPDDDPPVNVVIDAALAHLIQSEGNIRDARDKMGPEENTATLFCRRLLIQLSRRW